ncbi:serine-rich adhesin for platelets [Halyomorpha halys]|uniref:serine-rich adhesin for platelets n=1 Tax=Halyomorpha halys TaxID=286706 RepID=UPI0006D50724|nr:uncharacterized protein LOC106686918 [Halyomorpha halys]
MKKILIGFLVVGTCGIAYTSPIPENSTPHFQTVPSSTEKNANEAHSTTVGKKEITLTTPSTTKKSPEVPKSVAEDQSGKGLGVTVTTVSKNEASTSQSHKDEPTVTPSSNKAEIKDSTPSSLDHKSELIASSPSSHKQEGKEITTISSVQKAGSTNPSATDQKGLTTIKPVNGDMEKKLNNQQKPTKTSTAYLDKGKVVIFNGICGPDGCEIEGDIYDELVPLQHPKKQG